jgi:hypothetical protein
MISSDDLVVYKGCSHDDDDDDDDLRKKRVLCLAICMVAFNIRFVIDRKPNRVTTRYVEVMGIILHMKDTDHRFFTRMFRLNPVSFDRVLSIISPKLVPTRPGGKNIIPPLILLCLALRILAGGSYLDLSLVYDIPRNIIHQLVFKVIFIIATEEDPYINNVIFPIGDYHKLRELEEGFASLSKHKIRGTVAAGDGIVLQMIAPSNVEVEKDAKSYFVRKNYYALGLQVIIHDLCI